jgi:hypothetical protein
MQNRHRAPVLGAAVGLFLLLSVSAFPASVLVPTMELITHGSTVGGSFTLLTYGNMELSIEGGYKFGGSIAFGLPRLPILPLEAAGYLPLSLSFLSASMTIRDVLNLPVNVSYFIGANDVLCSGDGFTQFGVAPIMTAYRGFMAFPTGPMYDGIYQVWGTGMHLQYVPQVETASIDLYVYEDTHPPYPGGATPLIVSAVNWSADIRFLLNLSGAKLEAFAGATLTPTESQYGLYRGGLLFYAADRNVEFLAQIGIPLWDPATDPLSVDLFYLLVEPRLHLGIVSIVPTFFWHPRGYMQAINPTEVGSFDVNLNIFAGDVTRSALQGGIESNITFRSSAGQVGARVSPWLGFSTQGIIWTLKVTANLIPFNLATVFEGFVGVRAQF